MLKIDASFSVKRRGFISSRAFYGLERSIRGFASFVFLSLFLNVLKVLVSYFPLSSVNLSFLLVLIPSYIRVPPSIQVLIHIHCPLHSNLNFVRVPTFASSLVQDLCGLAWVAHACKLTRQCDHSIITHHC